MLSAGPKCFAPLLTCLPWIMVGWALPQAHAGGQRFVCLPHELRSPIIWVYTDRFFQREQGKDKSTNTICMLYIAILRFWSFLILRVFFAVFVLRSAQACFWDLKREVPFVYDVLSSLAEDFNSEPFLGNKRIQIIDFFRLFFYLDLASFPNFLASSACLQLQRSQAKLIPQDEDGRVQTFKAFCTLWGFASDMLLCCLPFMPKTDNSFFPFIFAPDFWSCLAASVVLRFCASPSIDLRRQDVDRVILLLHALCVGIGLQIPNSYFSFLSMSFSYLISGRSQTCGVKPHGRSCKSIKKIIDMTCIQRIYGYTIYISSLLLLV